MSGALVGQRVAQFEITAHLGAGGMGDVYEARDSELGRLVALKFLPDVWVDDPVRAARFKQEARALAALNHPGIATLHGLEEDGARRFLVMELVPGETLAARLAWGPMDVEASLDAARQIAEALEAAHDRGVVHRDLKPANVKIAPDGRVKILDFGLAKLGAEEQATAKASPSTPTITLAHTGAGTVLGTPAYMAPEQARGLPVDRRADIFAFGCILYEMLTGRPAFAGDSVADVLAAVLQKEPDWTRLGADVPPHVQRLLRLCLAKDPRGRRQSAGDVRIDLEQPPETVPIGLTARPGPAWAQRVAAVVAIGVIAVLAVPAISHLRETPPPGFRLEVVTPPTRSPESFALSPDGRWLAFVAEGVGTDTTERLHLRALATGDVRPLTGSETARLPFWSPDSRSIGYFAAGRLHRVDIAGGPPQALAFAPAPLGGAWGVDGTILFAPNTLSPLLRVPATGGTPIAATTLDAPRQTTHRYPSFLPDGRFIYYASGGDPTVVGLHLGTPDDAPTRLVASDGGGEFLAPDRLVFIQQGRLVAARIDLQRGVLVDEMTTLAEQAGSFSVSPNGLVAHRAEVRNQTRLVWVDRAGRQVGDEVDFLNGPELSPDGRWLAGDRTVAGNRDVWLVELGRGAMTRFTNHPAIDGYPLWSPDGSQIAFHSQRNGTIDLWIRAAFTGQPERVLLETAAAEWPLHWSRDGRYLLYQRSDLESDFDLWALPMTGTERVPMAVATSPALERLGEFSPDGKWIAFETDETGRAEIVVQAFPKPQRRIAVSTAGGQAPRWSADGHEIFFIAPDGRVMASPIATRDSTIEPGTPTALFDAHVIAQTFKYQYVVARGGRFLINQVIAASAGPIHLIVDRAP